MMNATEKESNQHCGQDFKHMLLMAGCCLAPIVGILLLQQRGYDESGNYLLLLLCPLMHLFMMRSVNHKNECVVKAYSYVKNDTFNKI